jgi:hypothetical protein
VAQTFSARVAHVQLACMPLGVTLLATGIGAGSVHVTRCGTVLFLTGVGLFVRQSRLTAPSRPHAPCPYSPSSPTSALDFFGDDDVLYLSDDMATGEIRLSILCEWVHEGGAPAGSRRARSDSGGQVRSSSPHGRSEIRRRARAEQQERDESEDR